MPGTSHKTTAARVFVSHAHADERFVKKLHEHLEGLKKLGLISIWNDREIRAGSEWVSEIAARLDQADLILLLISPAFIASDYCYGLEMKRALERHEAGAARVIPIILRPTNWTSLPFSSLQALPENGRPVSTWRSQDDAFRSISEGIREVISTAQLTPQRPQVWNVPSFEADRFVGREKEIAELRKVLLSSPVNTAGSTVLLAGIGGVGKTQLALHYAHRYASEYSVVWWINAHDESSLVDGLAQLALKVGAGNRTAGDSRELARSAKRWLEQAVRWLLVLDDAQRSEGSDAYIPRDHRGHIILTSRFREWIGGSSVINLMALSRQESIQLLLDKANSSDFAGASRVVEKVGDLPLLLSLCGSYVRERNSTFPELLNWFEEPGAPDARASSVAACTKLAVADMEAESAEAVELLNCCAFLAEDEIPFELFRPAEGTPELDQETVRRAAQRLSRRSLASISESGLRVHPLIADAMQARLTPGERDYWISEAARLLGRSFAAVERSKGITQAGELLPHAMAVAEHAIKQQTSLVSAARLLCEVGLYYRSKSDIQAAKAIMERALAIAEGEPRIKPAERAGILDQLGGLFEDIGDFTSAHNYYETAITVLRDAGDARLLGRELLNRGRLLFNLGRHVEAVATFGEAVGIARREASHADIAAALGNIGSAYRALGDWSADVDLFRYRRPIVEKTGQFVAFTFFRAHRSDPFVEPPLEVTHGGGDRDVAFNEAGAFEGVNQLVRRGAAERTERLDR